MEIPATASNTTRLLSLYGFLVISLLISHVNADGKIKQVTDPTGNVNLSPFQQWRSAYECLQNTSESCSVKFNYTLTEEGWMNVTDNDRVDFCKSGGCKEHTEAVLTCIHLVKRDFRFENKATVQDLNRTIQHRCDSAFDGTTFISDASSISKSAVVFLISILAALFPLMHFDDKLF